MVKSSRGLNSVGRFYESSFRHSRVPWNISQPQCNIEKVNDFVPCIRRQRFTRIVKAPKRISCHLELGNLNVHIPIMCKPMYTATNRGENRHRYKIMAVVVYIFCEFPIKPRNLQSKNKLPC